MQICSEINMCTARYCLFSFCELVRPKRVSCVPTVYAVLEHMFAVQKLVDGAEDLQWGNY